MGKISVVINTHNEEENLPHAVASIKKLANEIVVVDMESTDKTVSVARKLGTKVFSYKMTGYVEPARNFAIEKAKYGWVLILDADEEVPTQLSKLLKEISSSTDSADYYGIPRKNMIFGKWIEHSRWWPDYNIRFFKKGAVSWNEVIHSVPMTVGRGKDIESKSELAIIHHNYDSVEQYIKRMDRYTSLHSVVKIKEGYKFVWQDLIIKPADEFFSRYFYGQGYKDGVHGLALSLLQGFSELVLYLKIWQAEKFTEQNLRISEVIATMRQKEKDQHYWQADAGFKETGSLKDRVRRKLKI